MVCMRVGTRVPSGEEDTRPNHLNHGPHATSWLFCTLERPEETIEKHEYIELQALVRAKRRQVVM